MKESLRKSHPPTKKTEDKLFWTGYTVSTLSVPSSVTDDVTQFKGNMHRVSIKELQCIFSKNTPQEQLHLKHRDL